MAPRPRTPAARRSTARTRLPRRGRRIRGINLAAATIAALLGTTATLTITSPATAETSTSRPSSARTAELQAAVTQARAAYELARQKVAGVSAQAERLDADADRAEQSAQEWRAKVGDQQGSFLHAVGDALTPGESDLDQAADAAQNAEDARALADMVTDALGDAIAGAEQARTAWDRAQAKQARREARWTADQFLHAELRRARFPRDYAVTDRRQDARNRAALDAWHGYLHDLARARVVPPPASDLADPAALTAPLEPLRDATSGEVPGVAEVDPPGERAVVVLPVEAVHAVSDTFRRLGLATIPGDDAGTPTDYACGGLVARAWGGTTLLPADAATQWTDLSGVRRDALQPGDVVVLGGKAAGLGRTGVYLGPAGVVLADATTGTAGVSPLPAKGVLGVRRASLDPADASNDTPPAGGLCGVPEPVATSTGAAGTTGDGPLQLPVAEGSYHLSAGFGDAGGLWSSGAHTGQDFAAPTGTPVTAAAAGTVTVEHPGWAGNLVRIDSGGGVETLYAHLSQVDVATGDVVAAGQQVGLVGEEGNTTGPHLHFEVRLDGSAVDPAQVLRLPTASGAAYANGEAPDDALCSATTDGGQRLRCDAAVAYRLLDAAYEDALGGPICITDSYRDRALQERTFALKPGLAAKPGTSEHGWGLAVDLCGGIERFGTPEHDWLVAHGPAYGWTHPAWAEAGGSRPEPWHFEYTG